MSCYMVNYNTMNRVSTYLAKKKNIEIFEYNKDGEMVLSKKMKELIKKLWDLNLFSLCERYGEKERENKQIQEHIKNYKYKYEELRENEYDPKKVMKFLKSFLNYTYQSCEGNASNKKLYKECVNCENEIAIRFACLSPLWRKLDWE